MILVDSSVLIEFLKGLQTEGSIKFDALLRQGLPFGISSVIFQEVLQGAGSEKEFSLLNEYLSTQRFYHLKDPIHSYREASRIYMKCRRKGITIRSTIDCLIAQTALENDLLLLHNDNDFVAMAKVIPLKFY
jgi:predicted nucleic acid-binding protein